MTKYYLVTGVLGHRVLCVPEAIFDMYFIVDGKYCTHEWYTYLYVNPGTYDEGLSEAWDNMLETYSMDSKRSDVTFGNLRDVDIVGVYQWLV